MTDKQEHTPGPWKIATNGEYGKTFRIWRNNPGRNKSNAGYACISSHVSGYANARLIAAAPALVAALENQEKIESIIREQNAIERIRPKGMFGVRIEKDDEAIRWQKLDEEKQVLIGQRRAALSLAKGTEVDRG